MTAILIALIAAGSILTFLVVGLLRSHAGILRRLHALDGGDPDAVPQNGDFQVRAGVVAPGSAGPSRPHPLPDPTRPAAAPDRASTVPEVVAADISGLVPAVSGRVPDVSGTTLNFETVLVRTSGGAADTILLFLSSGCSACRTFFAELADPVGVRIPPGSRILIVTKSAADESPEAIADLAAPLPAEIEVVMSTQAWTDFGVPGSPYVVAVDGPTGRLKGEGSGLSFAQVARLLAQATGDLSYLGTSGARGRKPWSDAERERQVDRELIAAGILPGDESLYPAARSEPVGG